MGNVRVVEDASMSMDTLKTELQHVFKELIGASLIHPRDGKNSSYYSSLFENIMSALEDYRQLAGDDEEMQYEEPAPRYPANSFKVIENPQGDQSRNLKFIAEELLIKVEHLLQKVSEKEHQQRLPQRER
jgi:hypothetical protein